MTKEVNISLNERLAVAIQNTQDLYLSDSLPWVIGYSGGKDSTATLQIVWSALKGLPPEKRTKPVHVISTDTLVENPVVAIWVGKSLEIMKAEAERQGLPIQPHRLTPKLGNRFWVNLIGRGYPAPRPMFRWCTSRLKISASTEFITDVADRHGEAILVLGSRKAESIARERVLAKYEHSTRELLSRNSDTKLERVWIYTPIDAWQSEDVWEYLVSFENPWGHDNMDLFHMYKGASPDSECPLVVDKSTPSCGDSRFGCFVCTMVSEDKSMQAMIQNDEEKRWMEPLLTFRNAFLTTKGDRNIREFTRIDGSLTLQELEVKSKQEPPHPYQTITVKRKKVEGAVVEEPKNVILVHGPYTQTQREILLLNLLKTQRAINENVPASVGHFELISIDEIEEIRRIWVHDKHEFEDSVPLIYEEAFGQPYPIAELDESTPFRPEDIRLLRAVCEEAYPETRDVGLKPSYLQFRTLRDLLDIQHSYRNAMRRVGLNDKLEDALESRSFMSEEEALEFAIKTKHGAVDSVGITVMDPYIQPAEVISDDGADEVIQL